jgi:hypothetical protein
LVSDEKGRTQFVDVCGERAEKNILTWGSKQQKILENYVTGRFLYSLHRTYSYF